MIREQLLTILNKKEYFRPGEKVLLAFSGGGDSVALLSLVWELSRTMGFSLSALHVNHGLREEAGEDERFCLEFCQKINVPLTRIHADVSTFAKEKGLGLEEAGRRLRYQRLEKQALKEGAGMILTAHHLNDQCETLLLNLLRGSGLEGLAAMKEQQLLDSGLYLIRPFLAVPKETLLAYLSEVGLEYCRDQSNLQEDFSRNFLRNRILPLLEERFPGASNRMAECASRLSRVEEHLQNEAAKWLKIHQIATGDRLPLAALKRLDETARRYVFRGFLEKAGGLRDVSAVHYQALEQLIHKTSGSQIHLPGKRTLLREQEGLRLLNEDQALKEKKPTFSFRLLESVPERDFPTDPYTKWLDYDIIGPDPVLRHRQEGDYIFLTAGRKKTLHRYMIDEKIPLALRDRLWLLARGSHVLWIQNGRISEAAKIGPGTRRAAEVSISWPGEEA